MPLLLLLATLIAPAHAARKELSVAEQYELGLRYLKRGYYIKALEQFNRIRNYHRDDPVSVKAELAIADVYYKKNEWDQARLAYDDFMRMHPRHPDLDYVVFRMGQSILKKAPKVAARDQTWTKQAVNTFAAFDRRFPDSEHKADVALALSVSQERLARKELIVARFYVRERAWPAVEGRASGLVAKWPDSASSPEAMELLATALAWQGRTEEVAPVLDQLGASHPEDAERLRARLSHVKPPADD